MSDSASSSNIYNGAECKYYNWSQSHSDIEIRIKLDKMVKYEQIDMALNTTSIKVELKDCPVKKKSGLLASLIANDESTAKVLLEGDFEHPVHPDSLCWLIDSEMPSIVIYIDKAEDMWWKQLVINEEVVTSGPKNYVVSMDQMDDGSRMVIDKLIVDQRNKKIREKNYFPPV